MILIKGLHNFKKRYKHAVLTIGTFDGVHLAHQRIIQEAVRQAKILKRKSMVLTFAPHPLRITAQPGVAPLITCLEHRIQLIIRLKVDICLVVDFNREFAKIFAEDFVKHILIDRLGIDYLIVGAGFRFGKARAGSFSVLKRLSRQYGFKIDKVPTVKLYAQAVSSTRIRTLLQKGKIKQANRLLGRTFSIYGKVERGRRRGRILGYPTANIKPEQEVIPLLGVYAVLVRIDKRFFPGILNIGARPTFELKRNASPTIEVHIFNFRKAIYNRKIEVFFIQRIRPEKRFISKQPLLRRIKQDEFKAKQILSRYKVPPGN